MSKLISFFKDTENFTIALFVIYVLVLTQVATYMLMQMVFASEFG